MLKQFTKNKTEENGSKLSRDKFEFGQRSVLYPCKKL